LGSLSEKGGKNNNNNKNLGINPGQPVEKGGKKKKKKTLVLTLGSAI
jgi:hypothetical protein